MARQDVISQDVISQSVALLENTASGRTAFLFGQSAPLRANFQPATPVRTAAIDPVVSLAQADAIGPVAPDVSAAQPSPDVRQDATQESAQDVPTPAPRPPEFGPGRPLVSRQTAQVRDVPAAPVALPETKGIFERLFGSSEPSGPVLAYANPQDGLGAGLGAGLGTGVGGSPGSSGLAGLGLGRALTGDGSPSPDRATAIYDISAKTVYLPNGTKLEAHSGLHDMLDDPRHVHVRMRGATPPAVYDLTLREKLFHGVQALRLTPINSAVFGRAGLLAHTFMLGPNGDSNGCVSFRNYEAFLQAFLRGEIKRLAVVARMN